MAEWEIGTSLILIMLSMGKESILTLKESKKLENGLKGRGSDGWKKTQNKIEI
jgi:hypothetical protein